MYFPKIHLVTKCVCSLNPAGQQVCVHQIHLILKSVFSHIELVQCIFLYDAKNKEKKGKIHMNFGVCDVCWFQNKNA